jgi:hypothetical protein
MQQVEEKRRFKDIINKLDMLSDKMKVMIVWLLLGIPLFEGATGNHPKFDKFVHKILTHEQGRSVFNTGVSTREHYKRVDEAIIVCFGERIDTGGYGLDVKLSAEVCMYDTIEHKQTTRQFANITEFCEWVEMRLALVKAIENFDTAPADKQWACVAAEYFDGQPPVHNVPPGYGTDSLYMVLVPGRLDNTFQWEIGRVEGGDDDEEDDGDETSWHSQYVERTIDRMLDDLWKFTAHIDSGKEGVKPPFSRLS